MKIYALNISGEDANNNFHSLVNLTSPEKKRKILGFRQMADAKRSLYAELLIRYLIEKRLGLSDERIVFELNEFGKPSLMKSEGDFHFNLSHSGDWVVCMLDSYPVGIDVEEIRPIDISLADRFFSPKEVEELRAEPIKDKLAKFFETWTLKESYIKAVGKGLSIPLNSFSILSHDSKYPKLCDKERSDLYFFRHYELASNYKLSACGTHNFFPDRVEKINHLSIKEWFKERI
jgi:4'-phosphopantetheinyl transferase